MLNKFETLLKVYKRNINNIIIGKEYSNGEEFLLDPIKYKGCRYRRYDEKGIYKKLRDLLVRETKSSDFNYFVFNTDNGFIVFIVCRKNTKKERVFKDNGFIEYYIN